MDETRTHGVGDLLQGIFRKQRRQPSLALQRLRQNWPGIVGEALGRVTWPARLARGVLWVTALDSGWAFNLQFVKADLLNAVRTFLDGEVTDLRYKVGELPEYRPPGWPKPEPGREPVSATEVSAGVEMAPSASAAKPSPSPESAKAARIPDLHVRNGFQRMAAKLRARKVPR